MKQPFLFLFHARQVASVVEDLTAVNGVQTYQTFHQNGLAGTGLTDDHVHFSVPHYGTHVVQNHVPVKTLYYIFYFNHSSNLLKTRSRKRIIMLLLTTAFVLARPTSSAPPRTLKP